MRRALPKSSGRSSNSFNNNDEPYFYDSEGTLYEDTDSDDLKNGNANTGLRAMLQDLQNSMDALLSASTDEYQLRSSLSSNLEALFDDKSIDKKKKKLRFNDVDLTPWKPPKSSGLANSRPINIPNKSIFLDRGNNGPNGPSSNRSNVTILKNPSKSSPTATNARDVYNIGNSSPSSIAYRQDLRQSIDNDDVDDDTDDSQYVDAGGIMDRLDQISPDLLRRALGFDVPDVKISSDWKPPSKHGLDNALPIIKVAPKKKPSFSAADPPVMAAPRASRSPSRDFDSVPNNPVSNMAAPRASRSPSRDFDSVPNNSVSNRSVQQAMSANVITRNNFQTDVEEEEDDEEEDDEDDDFNSTKPIEMSQNLKIALGLLDADAVKKAPVVTDWRPPARSGLDNSAPILQRIAEAPSARASPSAAANIARRPSNASSVASYKPSKPSRRLSASSNRSVESQRSTRSSRSSHGSGGSNIDDNEDDEDDGLEYGVDDYAYDADGNGGELPTGQMSIGLMKLLGLDTSNMSIETDWVPPSFTGLSNSAPIRPRK